MFSTLIADLTGLYHTLDVILKTDSVVLYKHKTLDYLLKMNKTIKNNHTCQKSIFCSLHLAKTINNNLLQIKYYYFHIRVEANR